MNPVPPVRNTFIVIPRAVKRRGIVRTGGLSLRWPRGGQAKHQQVACLDRLTAHPADRWFVRAPPLGYNA